MLTAVVPAVVSVLGTVWSLRNKQEKVGTVCIMTVSLTLLVIHGMCFKWLTVGLLSVNQAFAFLLNFVVSSGMSKMVELMLII